MAQHWRSPGVTSRSNIMETSLSTRNGGCASPMSRPCRSTATRVQSSWTSSSLWDTKRTVLPCSASRRERAEELVALKGADARGRFVEDEHARSQPQKAQQFELLALADGERADLGLEVQGEAQRAGQIGHRLGGVRAPGEEPAGRADEQVVHHAHGREVQWVLMQHAHPVTDGVRRRAQSDGLAVEDDLSAIRGLEPGQDLHEGALAGAVLAQDAHDGARWNGQGDAVIGFDWAEMLSDVCDSYFQPSSGPACQGKLRGETETVSPLRDASSECSANPTRKRSGLPCPRAAAAGTRPAGRWRLRRLSGRRCRPGG